jgi:hypothetical protein
MVPLGSISIWAQCPHVQDPINPQLTLPGHLNIEYLASLPSYYVSADSWTIFKDDVTVYSPIRLFSSWLRQVKRSYMNGMSIYFNRKKPPPPSISEDCS